MKSFISGFESIFGVSAEEIELGVAEDQVDVLPMEQEKPDDEPQAVKPRKRRRKKANVAASQKASTKNFTSDLESLFKDALTNSFEEPILKETLQDNIPQEKSEKEAQPEVVRPRRRKRRVSKPGGSGLDLLIRQTSDETILEYESATKRVSFVFDKEKLKKLKNIAKERKLFLKDVIGEVVTKFIQDYEASHGKIAGEIDRNIDN